MNQETQSQEPQEPKKIPFCRKSSSESGVISFLFGNGVTVELDTNKLSDEQKFNLMMHGGEQKGGDSYASAKGDYTFAIAAVQKVVDQLENDQWNASRASTGEGAPRVGELAQAIAFVKGADITAVTAAVSKATDEQRKTWRKHPAVAAAILKIRSDKAAARLSETTGDDQIVLDV